MIAKLLTALKHMHPLALTATMGFILLAIGIALKYATELPDFLMIAGSVLIITSALSLFEDHD